MLNIRHILFPTDFSENALNALPFAKEVAGRFSARLSLMHIIEAPVHVSHDPDELPKTHSARARKLIEQHVKEIQNSDTYSDVTVNSIIENGNVVTSILDYAKDKKNGIDLVIMGTQGKSKMEQILYGGVTSRIMLDSPVPVLTVPSTSHTPNFDPIALATDFRPGDWQVLQAIDSWADIFSAKISVLHVAQQRDFDTNLRFRGLQNMAAEQLSDHSINFELIIQKQFLTGIADYLTDHHLGLLVLTRYKKGLVEKLLTTDHTKQLSYYSKVPMLVVPAP